MYLADCIFPDIESQLAAYKSFYELWDSGEIAQADHADGFEILFRVHPPGAGRVTLLFKAESDAQIFEHFASWRAQFGIGSLIITKNYLRKCPDRNGRDQAFTGDPVLGTPVIVTLKMNSAQLHA